MDMARRGDIVVGSRGARPDDDHGNLMLLSGILITVAFIVTALTLAQVSSLERQAAAEAPATLSSEWRFLHERIPANINVSIASDTKNETFLNVTFPAIAETFRSVEAEKGYDIVLRLANDTLSIHPVESDLRGASGNYSAWSVDGRVHYTQAYDGRADGLLWNMACPDTSILGGCVTGVLVYVHLSDGASSIDEAILVPANNG